MSESGVKFAYWVPNVSGGLGVSSIEQRTDWSYEYNRDLAVLAENNGVTEQIAEVSTAVVAKADVPAVQGFRDAVQQAGPSTGDRRGMWADSSFEDLVQYNDGFRTRLIGTPEQIAERIVEYRRRGVDLLLLGFLHYQEEVAYFGKHVLPIVRELEADLVESKV